RPRTPDRGNRGACRRRAAPRCRSSGRGSIAGDRRGPHRRARRRRGGPRRCDRPPSRTAPDPRAGPRGSRVWRRARGRVPERRTRRAPSVRSAWSPPSPRDARSPPASCTAGGSISRRARSGVLPVPDLEVQQRPYELLVVLPPRDVLVERAVEDAPIVVAAGARLRTLQVVEDEVAHGAAEPAV